VLHRYAGQQVSGGHACGFCAYQLDKSAAGDLWGKRLAHLLEVFLLGLAVASRVRAHGRPAEVCQRRGVFVASI
jgi:hypothetical protein